MQQPTFRKDKFKKKESSTLIRRVVDTIVEKTASETAKMSLNLKVEGQDLSVAMFADVIKVQSSKSGFIWFFFQNFVFQGCAMDSTDSFILRSHACCHHGWFPTR